MKRTFEAICPQCNSIIYGEDDWEKGDICIQGWCPNCKQYVLEDEVDWKEK